jgi:hypothetical protein
VPLGARREIDVREMGGAVLNFSIIFAPGCFFSA